ncbi:MAG: ACP S-malonyltransferase [Myxococcales bacterium]|nr:ACP S-malonyltransferase [Myxococcales bacterium]
MAAVIGLDIEDVKRACVEAAAADLGPVSPANMNSPEQTVISGSTEAVARASELATATGAKRVLPLPVSAPFHCSMMQPAALAVAEALEAVVISPFRAPVVSNVEAAPYDDPQRTKTLLVQQVTSPVRWVESVQTLANLGVTVALEVGPGQVLQGLVKRIDKRVVVHRTESPDVLERALREVEAHQSS